MVFRLGRSISGGLALRFRSYGYSVEFCPFGRSVRMPRVVRAWTGGRALRWGWGARSAWAPSWAPHLAAGPGIFGILTGLALGE